MARSAALPTPSPTPSPKVNADLITPGVLGFLAILFVAAVTVLLIVDMNRRVRRVRYRGELRERLERSDPTRTDPVGIDRTGRDRTGTDRTETDRTGTDRPEDDRRTGR